jgi:hypothetical protein
MLLRRRGNVGSVKNQFLGAETLPLEATPLGSHLSEGACVIDYHTSQYKDRKVRVDGSEAVVARLVENELLHPQNSV